MLRRGGTPKIAYESMIDRPTTGGVQGTVLGSLKDEMETGQGF